MTRIAFLGTPDAAVPTLRALADSQDLALVITQPDRPRGRSRTPVPPAVKVAADELGIEVRQPVSGEEIASALGSVEGLELAIVVAYGRLLEPRALALPDRGMLNVHFSLLPRWRGAAPVARALLAGDPMTGVTIIELDEGLDTGPVLTAQAVDIGADESAGELTTRLATLGARLVNEAIPPYVGGDIESVPQSDEGMTYASKIESGERVLDVAGSTERALNQVRAFSPEPGATLGIDGSIHQILRARPQAVAPVTGTWIEVDGRPVAGFGDGGVELVEIQPPGRRVMDGDAWLRGRHGSSGLVT